jgi:hypothetical protein
MGRPKKFNRQGVLEPGLHLPPMPENWLAKAKRAPLAVATDAGSEMRQSLGTAVTFGMLGVTLFGLPVHPDLLRRGAATFRQCVFAEREDRCLARSFERTGHRY